MLEREDDLGTAVRLDGPAQRIVCLVPSITETLFAFGAGSRVAGITDYCIHPYEELRGKLRIGGTKNFRVEGVIALNPDLVIANAEENRKHQIDQLRGAGIQVFVTFPKTVDGCLKMMRDLAALTGTEDNSKPVLDNIQRARAEVGSGTPTPAPRVLCPIWKNPYMTVNRDTFVDSVIRESGGRNVFEDAPERYPRFTMDDVAIRRPDVIILPTEPYHFADADRLDFKNPAIPVHIVEGELLSWYGPRVARALRELSSLFEQL